MSTPKTFSELLAAILPVLPSATVEEDLDGQLVIYTGLMDRGMGVLSPIDRCDCCGQAADTLYDGAAGGRLCDTCTTSSAAHAERFAETLAACPECGEVAANGDQMEWFPCCSKACLYRYDGWEDTPPITAHVTEVRWD